MNCGDKKVFSFFQPNNVSESTEHFSCFLPRSEGGAIRTGAGRWSHSVATGVEVGVDDHLRRVEGAVAVEQLLDDS